MKKIIAAIAACTVTATSIGLVPVSAATAENKETAYIDKLVFGDELSESQHGFSETNTINGIDDTIEPQYTDENGLYAGGGLGDGLTYRQMVVPESDDEAGMVQFTLKADPGQVTYITLRTSGSQYGRGNLMMYGADGDRTVLDAYSGREYAELINGLYTEGASCYGRYYYATYKLPEGMVGADGTVTLSIWHSGVMDSYGTSTYKPVTQPSMYLYSIYSSTDPYFEPDDDYVGMGTAPTANPIDTSEYDVTAYEYLLNDVKDMTETVMSWQCYGDDWEAVKTDENAFMDGAVITYSNVSEQDFSGTGDEVSRRFAQKMINFQNWSPMYGLTILANSYIFDFAEEWHNNPEILDRYFALLDFFERAQDSKGGWCYYTSGEDAGTWLGVSLDGTGERLVGEYWPLMSLGADAMIESFIMLDNYVTDCGDAEIQALYESYLDEIIDGNLTGSMTRTRRDYYMDMFGRLRDRMANPLRGVGDFYAPTNRAGTANQDFGYAYNANLILNLLSDGADVNSDYKYEDEGQYLDMVKYKYGEMVDGESWFSSENTLGLEGGASHGGWAGDYGTLLITITNEYAECSPYMSDEARELFQSQAYNAYEASKYFFYPMVGADGTPVLASECWASARKDGYGIHSSYPVAGFTATELGSTAALRYLQLYIEHNMGYKSTIKNDFATKSPHIYTNLVGAQNILKYYSKIEELTAAGIGEPLPMEDEHEDFAWYDADAHTIVFKNNGERAYITMNYRRDSWTYNDYTRIHFTTDQEDRTAEVRSTHQGDVYSWQDDTHLTGNGNPYTHYRYNAYEEVIYGNYICGINDSKTDASVGQIGQTYYATTTGVTKARDLISGTVYESENGEDIVVPVAERGAVVLEVLERADTITYSTIYKIGNTVLGFDNVERRDGDTVEIAPAYFEGYRATDESAKTVTITADGDNTTVYEYEIDELPYFTETKREVADADWQLYNSGSAVGTFETDSNGNPISITSSCDVGQGNIDKTFVYKEVTGDFTIHAKLEGFDKTVSDTSYFSIFATDGLDFENSNFFEERHFSNNNNILFVSHGENDERSTTSAWAGDMNNKSVPIHFIIERKGDLIEYWYSLDDGVTYSQTSKPRITVAADAVMYVGVALTSQDDGNTAYFSEVTIDGDMVGAPVEVGDTVTMSFAAKDAENDELTYELNIPDGAAVDEDYMVTFVPTRGGEYFFSVSVNDAYHSAGAERTVKVTVNPVIAITLNSKPLKTDVPAYMKNDTVLIPARAISEAVGAEVEWDNDTETVTITKDDSVITLTVGADTAEINGASVELGTAAEMSQSRVMVPLRFVLEALSCEVDWDGESVSITTK